MMNETEKLMRGLIELLYINGHLTSAQYSEILNTIILKKDIELILQDLCCAWERDDIK